MPSLLLRAAIVVTGRIVQLPVAEVTGGFQASCFALWRRMAVAFRWRNPDWKEFGYRNEGSRTTKWSAQSMR
jgi:hypothetical protein